jgi:hypothetical protein
METQAMQQDNSNQTLPQENLQYQVEENLQLAENPFKVNSVSIPDFDNPVEDNAPQEQQVVEENIPSNEAPIPVEDDIETLRAKLAEMEERLSNQQPQVEYRMPDEVKEVLENPAVLQMLNENFENKTVLDLIKDAFKEANPWAKTDRHIEAHLRRQYPDIDFDIPENLGLAEEDYDAIAWQAEGIRQQRIAQQQEVRGKLEAAMSPQQSQIDLDGYQNQFNQMVEDGLKETVKPLDLSLGIPGYNLPKVDAERIRDIVYSDGVPLSLDQNGNVWPNIKAAKAMAELEMLKSQIPAMLEAARRSAPKEAVEAINRTLNNQVPQNNVAPIDPKQVVSSRGPSIGGLRIVGVQSNF